MWAHRPATEEMLDAACKNVKYLCALRCVMLEKLLRDFIIGTDIYLHARRNLSNEEFEGMVNCIFHELFVLNYSCTYIPLLYSLLLHILILCFSVSLFCLSTK